MAIGRQGIEMIPSTRWGTLTEMEKRQVVQKEVCKIEEHTRMGKVVGIKRQRSWLH